MGNYRKLLVTLFLTLAGGVAICAQNLVKVSGVVTSADDGLPLVGVAVMAGPGNGVITSLDGDYVIEVTPGTELTFSSIGFMDDKVVVPSVESFTYDVVMRTESVTR